MAIPTDAEREAFLWMQGRMVELLQRHHVGLFERTFAERSGDPEAISTGYPDEIFRRQRDLAVFFYLRGELFDSILPRIKRRLSFVAPHALRREELPPRGRIDWPRTAAGALRDRPGEPPLTVYTRRRRRHFDTPENLLTVITLLEYRDAAQALLDAETAATSTPLIRHPLHDIVEGCTRELVFPQFAGLLAECQGIRDGQGRVSVEDLEETVAANLLPGRNSAYDDLLEWRHRLHKLRLLDRTAEQLLQPMISPDPKRDNYLYQLWLFYELGDLLQQQGKLRDWDYGAMALRFVWGEGSDEREYRLQHDRQIPDIPQYWTGAPGVRPDFYIMRTDRQMVMDGKQVIWHEPGYVLDAKYYRPADSDLETAPASPIKRMIADLQLTGERYGALLFAFHGEPSVAGPETEHGRVRPNPQTVQRSAPDVEILIRRIQPGFLKAGELLQTLIRLLNTVHAALQKQEPVRCHGVFLDTLTETAHGKLASADALRRRNGKPWPRVHADENPLDDLLLCPKPHVGPWRIDLVSRERDCCQNATLCHIKHQAGVHKPARLTMLDAVTAAIQEAVEDANPEVSARRAEEYVRTIGRRYVQLLQQDLGHYQNWVQQELEIGEAFETTPLLNAAQRETLGLARFLWVQIEQIGAHNYAAPVLLFTGVLEEITQGTIYKVQEPPLCDVNGKPLMKTLGTLGNCKGFGGANWLILEQTIVGGGYWNAQMGEGQTLAFEKWINRLQGIVSIRNQAAHHAHVDKAAFDTLTLTLFGSRRTGMGLLNGLLLAWVPQAEAPIAPS